MLCYEMAVHTTSKLCVDLNAAKTIVFHWSTTSFYYYNQNLSDSPQKGAVQYQASCQNVVVQSLHVVWGYCNVQMCCWQSLQEVTGCTAAGRYPARHWRTTMNTNV